MDTGGSAVRLKAWTGSRSWALPIVAVALFVGLYLVAASLYPGSTRDEPHSPGFSVLRNYWCDLLDRVTYGGAPNPARPVALVATVVLCTGLGALWWLIPGLFVEARKRALVVRGAAAGVFVAVPGIATHWHDVAINVAGAFGLVGFVAAYSALSAADRRALRALTVGTLTVSLVNYGIWQSGLGLGALPLIQKGAFALFLAWIVRASLLLRQRERRLFQIVAKT